MRQYLAQDDVGREDGEVARFFLFATRVVFATQPHPLHTVLHHVEWREEMAGGWFGLGLVGCGFFGLV